MTTTSARSALPRLTFDDVLALLDGVKTNASGAVARCPAHEDRTASLSIGTGADGRVLLRCHAGCGFNEIVAALGISASQLMPERLNGHNGHNGRSPKPKGRATAEEAIRILEQSQGQPVSHRWDYHDLAGRHVGAVCRFDLGDGKKTFRPVSLANGAWQAGGMPSPRPLYRLPEVAASAERGETVFVAEGEKAADALRSLGVVATTSAHGAQSPKGTDWSPLAGREVVIWPDHDAPGEKYATDVAAILLALKPTPRVRIMRPEGMGPGDDAFDWCEQRDAAEPDALRAELQAMADAAEVVAGPEPAEPPFKIEWMTSAEFDDATYRMRFLVKKITVGGQPAIVGGAQKVLKTSIAADEVISLGTGKPFLGFFEVPEVVPVGILSAESGPFTLQNLARRVAASKGVLLRSANVRWGFKVPQLGLSSHLDALRKAIEADGIKAVFLDPAYLSLLADDNGQPIEVGNLFAMGRVLGKVSEAFASVDCTLKVLHHETKSSQNFRRRSGEYTPPELTDLSQSGWAEWARQWLLIGRRQPFQQGTGQHQLWINVGGSAGHGGLWAVDVDEGILQDDFSGRKWEVTVNSAAEEKAVQANAAEERKTERQRQRDDEDRGRLLQALRETFPDGETQEQLRGVAQLSGTRFTYINQTLIAEGLVERFTINKRGRDWEAFRLKREKPSGELPFDGVNNDRGN